MLNKAFGQTENVAITVLVDNRADLIVRSTDTVKYDAEEPLLAEHGFAALVDLQAAGVRILWDAGVTTIALMENARRMKIDLTTIDAIAISHGHGDHTAALSGVLKAIDPRPKRQKWEPGATMEEMVRWAEGRRIPLVLHPAALRERWGIDKEGNRHGPVLPPPYQEWEALGAHVVRSEGPYELGPGCWSTGYVPRRSFEQSGRSTRAYYRRDGEFLRDDLEDDQAIVIHVQGKGLVVLSGCAHSGIVNTVDYACEISGVERVWAIIGGFHMARSTEDEIVQTIAAVRTFDPVLISPSHCTGFGAICRFAAEMPNAFVPGVVGATYLF